MKPERKTVKCEETDIRNGKCYMLCQDEYCSVFESQTICANSHTGMRKETDDEYITRLEWMVEWLANNCEYRHGISLKEITSTRIRQAEQAYEAHQNKEG